MRLNERQLAACKPIIDRIVPAQATVDEGKAHLALLLASWDIDFAAVRIDFTTGDIQPLEGPPGPPPGLGIPLRVEAIGEG